MSDKYGKYLSPEDKEDTVFHQTGANCTMIPSATISKPAPSVM